MLKEQEHSDIIDGCKRGDRKAQEQLYRYFYVAMMNLCVRYTKNQIDAKSVLNTGFFKVFKNIHQFDAAKATLYTWIRKIVVNCCLDYVTSSKSTIIAGELDDADELYSNAEISNKMNAEEILYLIRDLPVATQAVFNLFVIDGYGHKEIATLLKISEGTSKWHLSEAKKKLKQQLLQ